MFRKRLFILAHQIGDMKFYPTYKKLLESQWKTYGELEKEQNKQMRALIQFAYGNVPYYHKLFNYLKLDPDDLKSVEDLQKLPVLTKKIIKRNWEDFKPICLNKIRFSERGTGGSTGDPLKYRLEKFDRFLSTALLYRGWGYANYDLGDSLIFLGGSSIGVTVNQKILKKIQNIVRNIKMLSSYDMDINHLKLYTKIINECKPKYLRCYPTALKVLCDWINNNEPFIYSPKAIFNTAEKLSNQLKLYISETFNCPVFDTYGLYDGGISAYECSSHSGLHIDMERGIMEVIDSENNQIEYGSGKLLATSLHNFAMPFIRYNTGDLGNLLTDICSCGREYKLLKEIIGREYEMLKTPEGKYVYGGFFNRIFWNVDGITNYQIVQTKIDEIVVNIVIDDKFEQSSFNFIEDWIKEKSDLWNVKINICDKIEKTGSAKYKFIINNLL